MQHNWSTMVFFWLLIQMHLHKFNSFLRAILFIEVCLINPWADKQRLSNKHIADITDITFSADHRVKSKTPPCLIVKKHFLEVKL